ncbi:hypothetical protein H9Y04_31975 [Streptomyces sp. TRM66268-LWL]|uniref:Lipoprotein n=1 Tax=Streptomyces polyasparticus TaxID=2767826 RepID=A0ABR7SNV1_9ACTN|nr:hypothetical protein [Streptomyces polyasparticus]MBC9717157.1 hypothetical protein [Streptomyces polyasparticus]
MALAAALLVGCTGESGADGERTWSRGDSAAKQGQGEKQGRGEERGEKLAAESFRLFREATSVRMTRTSGAREQAMLMDRKGNCTGTYDAGPMKRAEVLVVTGPGGASDAYIRYTAQALAEILDEAERRGPATEAEVKPRVELIRGKYLKMSDPDGTFGRQCNLEAGARSLPFEAEAVEAGAPTVRHGVRVIPLTGRDAADGTLYVAAEGPPQLRYATRASGDELSFTDYGTPVRVQAPPAHLVVEADDMAGGLLDA